MMTSTIKKVIGAVLLILGIIAAIMPVLPGAWLIFVGLELLGLGFLIPEWIRKHGRQIKGWFLRMIGKEPPTPSSGTGATPNSGSTSSPSGADHH